MIAPVVRVQWDHTSRPVKRGEGVVSTRELLLILNSVPCLQFPGTREVEAMTWLVIAIQVAKSMVIESSYPLRMLSCPRHSNPVFTSAGSK